MLKHGLMNDVPKGKCMLTISGLDASLRNITNELYKEAKFEYNVNLKALLVAPQPHKWWLRVKD